MRLVSLSGYDLDKCGFKLHRLWWWALTYAEDGDLQRFDFKEIGLGVGIEDQKEAEKFVQAVIDSGFIDAKTMFIHDWLDYAGRYLHSKYHSSNLQKWKRILKKHKGKPKGRPKADFRADIDKITRDNQPNLTKDSRAFFDAFWAAYPKKRAKGQAEKTFRKIHPDEQLLAKMVASIERAKTLDDWRKQGGRYIPHPATWLNAKRWLDEFGKGEIHGKDIGRKGFDLPSEYPNDLADYAGT